MGNRRGPQEDTSSGGRAGRSRGYGHLHQQEGTRDPETKAAEHGHYLLGEEQEAEGREGGYLPSGSETQAFEVP